MPLTLAHDGRSFFAAIYSGHFSGIAKVVADTGAVTKIKAFPDPSNDQASATFDGRWLVWNEYHGFDSFNDFTTWAWDIRTGTFRQIGAAARAPDGQFWESPWRSPDVRAGVATWVQGSGPDGLTDVHVYDLRSSRDAVVRRGHALGSFLLGGHLVAWPESPSRGARTRMYAASTVTGGRVSTPRALRGLRGVSGLATNGRRIAYPSAPYKALLWSPSLRAMPREIVAARNLDHIDNSVQVGGRYIGFGMQPRLFVADTQTHGYLQLGNRGGWTEVDKTALLVVSGPTKKVLHPVLRVAFVPLRKLPPLPACS